MAGPDQPEQPEAAPLRRDFQGLRVLSFESRMAREMGRLIERHGGRPLVVPALREVPLPLQKNEAVFRFGAKLILHQLDILILMTGVGTAALFDIVKTRHALPDILEGLKKTVVVTRGPKPLAALKALGVEANIIVPEPNTWHDVIATLDYYRPVKGLTIAIQEYGASNRDMVRDLEARGATVFPVPIYRWALPEDTGPLMGAIYEILEGQTDVLLITNAAQIDHVMQLVKEAGLTDRFLAACRALVVGSIGPTASERLKQHDILVDYEPSHPKMGVLVKELGERAVSLVEEKRRRG